MIYTPMTILDVRLHWRSCEVRTMRNGALGTSLRERRKWGFIDETIMQPEDGSPEIEDWWMVQSIFVLRILNTVESNLRLTMLYFEIAEDLWKDIKDIFLVLNGPRVQ